MRTYGDPVVPGFHPDPSGPGSIAFSVATSEGVVRPAEPDGRCPSTAVAGGFTGRVLGMYVTEGRAASTGSPASPSAGAQHLDALHVPF